MIKEESFFHPMYFEKTKVLQELIPFQDEIIACYKEFEGKLKKPDLLGKTVRVSEKQFPKLYNQVRELSECAEIEVPKIYLYEDFYYGVEAKGSSVPRIELSAKTLADFSASELDLAREICRIKYGMVKLTTVSEQAQNMMMETTLVPGIETLSKSFQIKYATWSRLSHYTADCFGYYMVKDLEASVKAILALVLNNLKLVAELNIIEYMAQARDIYLLDDIVSRYSENDEKVPYGPLRIKNLLAYAASKNMINREE